jgi:hypothetical protein
MEFNQLSVITEPCTSLSNAYTNPSITSWTQQQHIESRERRKNVTMLIKDSLARMQLNSRHFHVS